MVIGRTAVVSLKALSVGPAASLALSTPGAALRLHSLFPSALNLEVEGSRVLVALTGPSGVSYPHAVALDHPVLFPSLCFEPGDPGLLYADSIRLQGRSTSLAVALGQARRPAARVLPAITTPGGAWQASADRLECFQSRFSCALRLKALFDAAESMTPVGTALRRSALALGAAAHAVTRPTAALRHAVSCLVGMGPGLTPSGDDFLCGFIAASQASGSPALVSALGQAVELSLAATGEISASLLRCALAGQWPQPLADLADALAAESCRDALNALDMLCGLGHSSGADIATGFLFGVTALVACRAARRGGVPGERPLTARP